MKVANIKMWGCYIVIGNSRDDFVNNVGRIMV